MWANFGPTIQVKHLTLNPKLAQSIVNQVQSDNVIVVCCAADRQVIEIVLQQIDWGRKVRGIITEVDLEQWYERCLRGKYASLLAQKLLTKLSQEFKREFPQAAAIVDFIDGRGYMRLTSSDMWNIDLVEELRLDTETE